MLFWKRKPPIFAVIDAATEDLPIALGSVIQTFESKEHAEAFDAEFRDGHPTYRTRVVKLKVKLPVGASALPNDLAVEW